MPIEVSLSGSGEIRYTRFLTCKEGMACQEFFFGEKPTMLIEVEVFTAVVAAAVGIHLVSIYGDTITMMTPDLHYKPISLKKGKYQFEILINEVLMPGEYYFNLSLSQHHSGGDIDFIESVGTLRVLRDSIDEQLDYPWATVHGYYRANSEWKIKRI